MRAGRAGSDNVGIVHPYWLHHALRDLTRKYGTLLIIDETHTICAGPGGYTRAENLEPDFLVFGKPSAEVFPAQPTVLRSKSPHDHGAPQPRRLRHGGIGGTLAGNALSLAAMRATLTKVLTKEAFDRMVPMAERWTAGVQKVIDDFAIPWHVTRLGCRAEYLFAERTKNGTKRTTPWTSNSNASCTSTHESRHSANALPQHGSDVARNHARGRRFAQQDIPRGGAGIDGLGASSGCGR